MASWLRKSGRRITRPAESWHPGFPRTLLDARVFGRAITIGTALGLQRREQGGRVFGNAPTFLGLPIESSLVAERSRQEIQATSLVMNQTSVTWEQRARVAAHLGLSYSYYVRGGITRSTPGALRTTRWRSTSSSTPPGWNGAGAWDTRDDPLDSARGMLISSSFDFGRVETPAEVALSSDTFVRELVQAYYFRAWRSVVFASAARWGLMVPFGGSDVFRQEMFFAGGSRTVRGVPENNLGPRSIFDPDRAGRRTGDDRAQPGNADADLPVGGRSDVYRCGQCICETRRREPAGPGGIDRVWSSCEYAVCPAACGLRPVIWGLPEPGSGRWTFGIGQIF